jgi:4-hydroxy-tetrahydrodipicolinate reductase
MIKMLIFGPTGSMGKLITELALNDDEIEVVAACDVKGVGKTLESIVTVEDKNKVLIKDINNLESIIKITKPDVAVDFTTAKATEKNCLTCVENGVRCVIGTTALSEEFIKKFEELIKKYSVPAVISPNMATGVNVLFKMVGILAKYLSEWDIEIIEAHHHRKQDSPSGTALKIGQIISGSLGVDFDMISKFGRGKGLNKREIGAKNEIAFHAVRAGDIVGDHTILFGGLGERIELKHQAHSRICFAEGAIKAIKFIHKNTEPHIFSMSDILGLN